MTIQRDGQTIGTVSANAKGFFRQRLGAQPYGLHNIKIFSIDKAGRLSDTVSQNLNSTVHSETFAHFFLPPAFSLNSSALQVGTLFRIDGTSYPGSTVILTLDNNLVITASVDSKGEWSGVVNTSNFYIGTHTITALAIDSDGLQSPATVARKFAVLGEPQPPGAFKIPTILEPNHLQRFATRDIVVIGQSQPNLRVELYDGSKLIGSIFANNSGE